MRRDPTHSQLLPERLLRFVMLVSAPQVEFVRSFANYIGANRHASTAHLPGPLFCRFEQKPASSLAADLFIHHQTVHFRAPRGFEQWCHAHVHPPDHAVLGRFRYKTCAISLFQCPPEPCRHFVLGCRVSQLPGKGRNPRGIRRLRPANLHVCSFRFRRKRFSTASLRNSRSASAAIHRPARVPLFLILSAQ